MISEKIEKFITRKMGIANGYSNDKKIESFYFLNIIYLFYLGMEYTILNQINYFYASVSIILN